MVFLFCGFITSQCFSQGKLFSSSIMDSAYIEASVGKTVSLLPLSETQTGDVNFNLIFGTNMNRYDFFVSASIYEFINAKSYVTTGEFIIQDKNIFNVSMGIKYKIPLGDGYEFSPLFSLGIYPYKVTHFHNAQNIVTKSVTPLGFALGLSATKRLSSSFALTLATKYNQVLNSDEIKIFQIDAGIRIYP
jgi:hypothetical protein